MNVLFASAEVFPLAKTGGLADVAAALPAALKALGVNVRVIMPAYRGLAERLREGECLGQLEVHGRGMQLIGGGHPDNGVPMLLLDAPALYARDGSPYADRHGQPHADNALRFACFCEASRNFSLSNCSRLNAFTTRMPVSPSSATCVISAWFC